MLRKKISRKCGDMPGLLLLYLGIFGGYTSLKPILDLRPSTERMTRSLSVALLRPHSTCLGFRV